MATTFTLWPLSGQGGTSLIDAVCYDLGVLYTSGQNQRERSRPATPLSTFTGWDTRSPP